MRQRAVTLALVAMGALMTAALLYADLPFVSRVIAIGGSTFVYVALIYLVRARLRRHETVLQAVADGISGLHDRDYSVSITPPRDDSQLQRLVTAYNGLGATLRAQRQDLYQRELLLDTVIQASPLALVLTNATVPYCTATWRRGSCSAADRNSRALRSSHCWSECRARCAKPCTRHPTACSRRS